VTGVREKILRKAFILFAKKGYDGTRVDDIAKAAGVNKATIYYYFDSKKSLYQEVLYQQMSKLLYRIIEAFDRFEDDPAELVAHIVDVYFEFFNKNPRVWKLYLREICNEGRFLRGIIKKLVEENPILKRGGIAGRIEALGITSDSFTDGLHMWLNLLGMVFIHYLIYPFVEEIHGIKVDEAFLEKRKRSVLEMLERFMA